MKRAWTKPTMKIVPCDVQKIQGDIRTMSDENLAQQLIQYGYPVKKHYHSSPNYILRKIAGESVLVSVGDGIADFCGIVNLNASARILWEALQRGATKDELNEELQKHFPVSEERAAEDVEKTLTFLEEKGMVSCE